jgi:hypothetical protein
LAVVIPNNEASGRLFDGPGRREATGRHYYLRQEMYNSSDNDQDQQDCKSDPKLAHVALTAPNPLRLRASLRHKMND